MLRAFFIFVLLMPLVACDTSEDRINLAFPVDPEVTSAKLLLQKAAPDQSANIDAQFKARLRARALLCAKGYEPSWLASENSIRKAISNRVCFSDADEQLLTWLKYLHVGILLADKPLVPLPTKAPEQIVAEKFISHASMAENAGVVLLNLLDVSQILEVETGKLLLREQHARASIMGSLSPNGRLFVFYGDKKMEIRETQTGKTLMVFSERNGLRWIGSNYAVMASITDNRKAWVVDFSSGREVELEGLDGGISMVAPVPEVPNQYVLASRMTVAKIELSSNSEQLVKVILQQANEGRLWAINTTGLTADGKRFFHAVDDLILTSVDSLAANKISLHPFNLQGGVPTADPNKIIIEGFVRGASVRRGYYVYSLSDLTLAPIDVSKFGFPRFTYLRPLKKLALIDNAKITMLDDVSVGPAVPQAEFIAAALDEVSNKKIEAAERRFSPQGVAPAAPAAAAPARPYSTPSRPSSTTDVGAGQLSVLAKDARVEAIGVYEGQGANHGPGKPRIPGNVTVNVRRSQSPLVLVLSSYESVRWVLKLEPGAKLSAVLVSGYHPSQVYGAGTARIIVLGSGYAYNNNSPEYARLEAEVRRQTGKTINLFQGNYIGSSFMVGGS